MTANAVHLSFLLCMCVCKCRTGNQMATAGADKVVKLWDPTTGAHIASLRVSLHPSFLTPSVLEQYASTYQD